MPTEITTDPRGPTLERTIAAALAPDAEAVLMAPGVEAVPMAPGADTVPATVMVPLRVKRLVLG